MTLALASMVELTVLVETSDRLPPKVRSRAKVALEFSSTSAIPTDAPTATEEPAAVAWALVLIALVCVAVIFAVAEPLFAKVITLPVPKRAAVVLVTSVSATAAPMPTLPAAPFSASVLIVCAPVAVMVSDACCATHHSCIGDTGTGRIGHAIEGQ